MLIKPKAPRKLCCRRVDGHRETLPSKHNNLQFSPTGHAHSSLCCVAGKLCLANAFRNHCLQNVFSDCELQRSGSPALSLHNAPHANTPEESVTWMQIRAWSFANCVVLSASSPNFGLRPWEGRVMKIVERSLAHSNGQK